MTHGQLRTCVCSKPPLARTPWSVGADSVVSKPRANPGTTQTDRFADARTEHGAAAVGFQRKAQMGMPGLANAQAGATPILQRCCMLYENSKSRPRVQLPVTHHVRRSAQQRWRWQWRVERRRHGKAI